MRVVVVSLAALAVAVVVTWAMAMSDYAWWESLLVGVFCALPVLLFGAWLAERRVVARL